MFFGRNQTTSGALQDGPEPNNTAASGKQKVVFGDVCHLAAETGQRSAAAHQVSLWGVEVGSEGSRAAFALILST